MNEQRVSCRFGSRRAPQGRPKKLQAAPYRTSLSAAAAPPGQTFPEARAPQRRPSLQESDGLDRAARRSHRGDLLLGGVLRLVGLGLRLRLGLRLVVLLV